MKLDITKQKEKAISIMKRMNIYTPYIQGFQESGLVCFFERFGGYWADQDPELYAKLKEIEKKYRCMVYAITHEWLEFGECYSMLIVTAYPEEWATLVLVHSFDGGIRRIA